LKHRILNDRCEDNSYFASPPKRERALSSALEVLDGYRAIQIYLLAYLHACLLACLLTLREAPVRPSVPRARP